MVAAILSRVVDNQRLLEDRTFPYQSAKHVQNERSDSGRTYVCLTDYPTIPKTFYYFQDPVTEEWRRGGDNPLRTRRWLSVMAIGTLILYTLKLVFRTVQAVIILTGVFLRAYKETFSHRKEDDFSAVAVGGYRDF